VGPTGAAPTGGLLPPARTRSPRPVAATDDIPVGGGRVFPELRVVVTQPVAGEFHGFGIVCTHDGCELNSVTGGTINCPCHGSRFALTDGSVVRGPARTGLRTEKVTVDGDRILLL
jgi:Rieske Fe-S protein